MTTKRRLLQFIAYVAARDKRAFVLAFLFIFLGALFELVSVSSIFPFLALLAQPDLLRGDTVVAKLHRLFGQPDDRVFILWWGLIALLMFVLSNIFLYLRTAYINRYALRQTANIATILLRNTLLKPYEHLLRGNTGEMAKNIITHSDVAANGILLSALTIVADGCVLLFLVALLMSVETSTALTVVVIGTVTTWFLFQGMKRRVYRLGMENDRANGLRFQQCIEILQSVREIKVFHKIEYFVGKFGLASQRFASVFAKANTAQLLPSSALQTLAGVMLMGMAVWMITSGWAFQKIVTVVSLYAVAGYRMLPSLNRLSGALSMLKQHQPILEKVMGTLLITMPTQDDGNTPPPLHFREIGLSRIEFAYSGSDKPALADVTATIHRNCLIAFAGRSGSGKTTFANILMGLLTPSNGAVRVDGHDVDWKTLGGLRQHIAYVPQEIFLLDGTIAENVAFGIEQNQIDEKKVIAALENAELSDFVRSLPNGIHSLTGERGSRLSGGQRQRLGLARALYVEPSLLVLDESTSALDPMTEIGILDTLDHLKQSMTIVAVAHRKALLQRADTVLVFDSGRIVASGPYAEVAHHIDISMPGDGKSGLN